MPSNEQKRLKQLVFKYLVFLKRQKKHKNLQYVNEHFNYFSSKNLQN